MNTMKEIRIYNKKVIVTIGILVLISFIFWAFSSMTEENSEVTDELERTPVSLIKISDQELNGDQITVNGQVESSDQAVLSSEVGGIVQSVNVSIGQSVFKGQLLASFDVADVKLDLAEAEAALASQEAKLAEMRSGLLEGEIRKLESAVESAEINLEKTKKETEDAVESAKRDLFNNDLRAYLADESIHLSEHRNIEPPQISGTYKGEAGGEYRITLYRSGTQSGYSFRYRGPEGSGSGTVNTKVPQPLGKSGLYIVFPENFANRYDLEWVVPIPNERGTGYLSAKDAYESAKDDREPAVRQAEETLKQRKEDLELARSGSREEQIAAHEAQVKQAEARVEAARSGINKRQIRAPFAGTISKVSPRVGENVSPGEQMFVLANEQILKVNAQVSPSQARLMSKGDKVLVNGEHKGVISAISGAVDSQTGQVELEITIEDRQGGLIIGEYVKSDIFLNSGDGSVLLPLSAVDVSSAGNAVFVAEEGRVKRVPVSLGAIEGEMVNITGGLEGVDSVIEKAASVRSGQFVEVVQE